MVNRISLSESLLVNNALRQKLAKEQSAEKARDERAQRVTQIESLELAIIENRIFRNNILG